MAGVGSVEVIEWFRPPIWARLLLAWMVATVLLGVGVVGIAVAWDGTGRIPRVVQWTAGVIGAACTVAGATGGIIGIMRMLSREDAYLLVRTDGVVVADVDGSERLLGWAQMEPIALDEGHLVFSGMANDAVRVRARFMGISAQALHERLERHRRDALLGVLRRRPKT